MGKEQEFWDKGSQVNPDPKPIATKSHFLKSNERQTTHCCQSHFKDVTISGFPDFS